MKLAIEVLVVVAIAVAVSPLASGEEIERQMTVRQGPESVFSEAPAQIFAELAGAAATDQNGRVGNELVFWGYRLEDGREVFLIACAMIRDVNCAARENRVCENGSTVLSRSSSQGLVRQLRCTSVATVGVGDTRPGCTDTEKLLELALTLMNCH